MAKAARNCLDFRTTPRQRKPMKSCASIAAILYLSCALGSAQSFDKSKPYGRAAVGVVNTGNGDEEAFQAIGTPGRGKKVVAHFDATAKCDVLVAAFSKSGQLANGWPPHF